jgi:hypothetical protein
MGREASALRAERLLHHLDDDFLAFAKQIFDLRLRPIPIAPRIGSTRGRAGPAVAARPAPAVALRVILVVELVELLRVDHIVHIEESVALEAEVDEGGLHAGQDLRHAPLVDVADDAALALALDEDFGDEIILEDGHHGFVAVGGDDHLLVHFSRTPAAFGSRLSAFSENAES